MTSIKCCEILGLFSLDISDGHHFCGWFSSKMAKPTGMSLYLVPSLKEAIFWGHISL